MRLLEQSSVPLWTNSPMLHDMADVFAIEADGILCQIRSSNNLVPSLVAHLVFKIIVEQVCCNDKVDNHLTEDLHLFISATKRVSKLIENRAAALKRCQAQSMLQNSARRCSCFSVHLPCLDSP